MGCKPANDPDSQFSVLKYFIIQGDEQRADVLGLR